MRSYHHSGKLKHPVILEFDGYTLTLEPDQNIAVHVVVSDEQYNLAQVYEEIRRLRKVIAESSSSGTSAKESCA